MHGGLVLRTLKAIMAQPAPRRGGATPWAAAATVATTGAQPRPALVAGFERLSASLYLSNAVQSGTRAGLFAHAFDFCDLDMGLDTLSVVNSNKKLGCDMTRGLWVVQHLAFCVGDAGSCVAQSPKSPSARSLLQNGACINWSEFAPQVILRAAYSTCSQQMLPMSIPSD